MDAGVQRNNQRLKKRLVKLINPAARGWMNYCGRHHPPTRRFEPVTTFTTVCVVIVIWTLPNALILYNRRAKFAEEAEPKPSTLEN